MGHNKKMKEYLKTK